MTDSKYDVVDPEDESNAATFPTGETLWLARIIAWYQYEKAPEDMGDEAWEECLGEARRHLEQRDLYDYRRCPVNQPENIR